MAQSGLVTPGNIDLTNRPRVTNPDGSISTVRSISFGQDGKEILVPTVVDGRVVSDAEAIAHYRKTGQHLGIFTTPSAATAFAQRLHESEAGKLMPDTSTVVIVDDEGTEHQFPAGFDPKRAAQIVKNQKLMAANERPLQEPTTFGGGFAKGLNDYATELGQSAFEGAAQPRTAGDFLSLIGPSILPMRAAGGMKVIPGASPEPMGNRALRFGARRAADVMDITPNILTNKLEDRAIKGLRSIGEKEPSRFTDLPLSKQQRYLPQTPGPERRSVPPTQAEPTPFHERPLFQQQGSLPERPAPDVRTPMPSHVPQGTMNDLPLYKQQEILEKFGARTGAGSIRGGQEPPQVGGGSPASPSPLGTNVPVEGMVGEGSSAPAATLSPVASHPVRPNPLQKLLGPGQYNLGPSPMEGARRLEGSPYLANEEIPHGEGGTWGLHNYQGELDALHRGSQPGPLDELLLRILREGK